MDQQDKLYFWLPLVIIALLATSIGFAMATKWEFDAYEAKPLNF